MRERVFERFARGAPATDPAHGGSGLGLAIVRAVAEAHGGTVELSDAPDGGARFVVGCRDVPGAPQLGAVTAPCVGEPRAHRDRSR